LQVCHDYADKQVVLHVCLITKFSGEAEGIENQPILWVDAESLDGYDFPAANQEIIQKLKNEEAPKEKKKKIRFTMDLPVELHEKIKTKAARQGQIMKGYFVALALRDLEND
jgi:predicted DNA binding CopG/RHH family protein